MMVGVEIDLVVGDSLKSLAYYNEVFGIKTLEVSNYERGLNEAVFELYGTRIHLLDENPEYQLNAPKEGDNTSVWLNVMVENIRSAFKKAIDNGGTPIQEVVEMAEMGISNAIFKDPFGHVWMLHQVKQPISSEAKANYLQDKLAKKN